MGLETTTCRRSQGPSQLSTPIYSQFILRIYTAMNVLILRIYTAKVCPRAQETLGTALAVACVLWHLPSNSQRS